MQNHLLHYLSTNKSYKILKDFFYLSFGFHLTLINLDGSFAEQEKNDDIPASRDHADESTPTTNKRFLHTHLLHELEFSHEAAVFDLKNNGRKQILIPILIKNKAVGFVCVHKAEISHVTDDEYKTVHRFLTDYIHRLASNELEFIECFHDKELTHQQRVIKGVIEYIHEHYHNTHLTLKYVASQKGISYHYLSHLFKQEMKVTFNTYISQIRMEKASRLLQNKSLPINQIARHCGFEDPAYFSKAFKKKTGVSPAARRNTSSGNGKRKEKIIITLKAKHLARESQKILSQ